MASLALRRNAARTGPRLARHIWGVSPEPVADPLIVPLNVEAPVPMFDGATPTKVRAAAEKLRREGWGTHTPSAAPPAVADAAEPPLRPRAARRAPPAPPPLALAIPRAVVRRH